jgi:hypothetical protein
LDISAVLPGDVIEAEMRGSVFLAIVEERLPETDEFDLKIKPIQKHITNFHVTARDVNVHWKKMGRKRGRPPKSIEAPDYEAGGTSVEEDKIVGNVEKAADEQTRREPRKRPGQQEENNGDVAVASGDRSVPARDDDDAALPAEAAPDVRSRPRPGAKPAEAQDAPKPRPRPGAKPAGSGNPFLR